MAERLQGWESRLAALIEDARAKPYKLGEHDCFRMACAAVEALTGVDRWPQWSGYRTRREALRLLASKGHRSFDEAFSWLFGEQPAPMAMARRGDICKLVDDRGEAHLGVCTGSGIAVLVETGLSFIPRTACAHCWRVG